MKSSHAAAVLVIVASIAIAANARGQVARGFYTPEQIQDVMSAQAKEAGRGGLAECKSGFSSAATVARCLENLRVKSQAEFDAASQRMTNEMRALDAANPEMNAEAAFLSAEKAFAGFREADCRWHEAASGGGLKGNQLYRSCMVEQTRSRLAELDRLLSK
jgi:uncharacterized protein YecT (DUF1311 family)